MVYKTHGVCSSAIEFEVKDGKVAFGFTAQHKEAVLPVLLKALTDKEGGLL